MPAKLSLFPIIQHSKANHPFKVPLLYTQSSRADEELLKGLAFNKCHLKKLEKILNSKNLPKLSLNPLTQWVKFHWRTRNINGNEQHFSTHLVVSDGYRIYRWRIKSPRSQKYLPFVAFWVFRSADLAYPYPIHFYQYLDTHKFLSVCVGYSVYSASSVYSTYPNRSSMINYLWSNGPFLFRKYT